MTVIVFIAEMAIFSIAAPGFLNFVNWLSMTENFTFLGVMALSQTFVIMAGGIDLSVGSTMSLSGVMMGVLWQHGINIWIAAIFGILIGGGAGWVNGQLVVRTGIQPSIITLATLFIYGSLATVLDGQGSIYGFPQSFVNVGTGDVFGVVPVQLIIFGAVALVFAFVLKRTTYGRLVMFVGYNEEVAHYSGVSTGRVKVWTYVVSGLNSGLAAVLLGSYFASVRGDMGTNMELSVITICLVGGVSIFGGSGTISGVVLGTLILGMLAQGLNELNMASSEQSIVTGVILILAVGLQQFNVYLSGRRKGASKRPGKGVLPPISDGIGSTES